MLVLLLSFPGLFVHTLFFFLWGKESLKSLGVESGNGEK